MIELKEYVGATPKEVKEVKNSKATKTNKTKKEVTKKNK
jgi:hypothetical protein